MTSKHTPGPWVWNDDGQLIAVSVPFDPEFETPVVIVETDSGYYAPKGADRTLIAAAPDLLDALNVVLAAWDKCMADPNGDFDCEGGINCVDWETVRAAIAKAEGN